MDCDQVFNVLTRGPFPTGDPVDELVEAHLDHCRECWQIAEALRPAIDVFEEAVSPLESRDLPGYWGDSHPAAKVVAEIKDNLTSPTKQTSRVDVTRHKTHFAHNFEKAATVRDALAVVGLCTILAVCGYGFLSLAAFFN